MCNRVTHRRLFDIRRDDVDLADLGGYGGERRDARTVNPVVVGEKQTHAICDSPCGNSSGNKRTNHRLTFVPRHNVHIALIHNRNAGAGVYSTDDLVGFFRDLGDEVHAFEDDDADVARAMDQGPDVLVVAGGVGTVARIAIALCDSDVPMFIAPTGTSNNIARALGVDGTIPTLVARFAHAQLSRLDIGRIQILSREESFVEAVGVGLIGAMLDHAAKPRVRLTGWISGMMSRARVHQDGAARRVARLVRREPVRPLHILADGDDISGEFVGVEITNIAAIGPRIVLAPAADPGDGWLDLVLVRESDRAAFADYVESGDDRAGRPPALHRRVRRVEVTWPGPASHVDDELWPRNEPDEHRTAIVSLRGSIDVLKPAPAGASR